MKTRTDITELIKSELSRIVTHTKVNDYGDLISAAPDTTVIAGRHPHGLKCSQLDGWKKGRPIKSTVHVTSPALEALTVELAAFDTSAKKTAAAAARAAQKTTDQHAASAAGFKTVTAWKKAEKERRTLEEAQASEIRRARNAERLEAVGLAAGDTDFLPVLPVLEEAKREGFDIEHEHARAALYARRNQSSAWNAYNEGDLSASQFLHRSERAQDRHENTDYDQLLRAGFDRELARDCRERY